MTAKSTKKYANVTKLAARESTDGREILEYWRENSIYCECLRDDPEMKRVQIL